MYSISEKEHVYITKYLSCTLSFEQCDWLFTLIYSTSRAQATSMSSIRGSGSSFAYMQSAEEHKLFGFLYSSNHSLFKPCHSADVIVALPTDCPDRSNDSRCSNSTPNTMILWHKKDHFIPGAHSQGPQVGDIEQKHFLHK